MNKKGTVIKLENVCKTFRMGLVDVKALRGINLVINEGEFVAIMGPSGSGKSTMMNMVGCLDIPTCGNIFLDGKNIAHLHESDLAQIRGKKIGFIFQKFNLINTLSALENVMLPMVFQDVPKEEREKLAVSLLNKVGLGDRMHHKPNELSGGQQQRVAIARALANNPEVILADEPTGNLDTKTGEEIIKLLGELNKSSKKTVIMVTHDQEVAQYANRIEHLRDGLIEKTTNNQNNAKNQGKIKKNK